MVYSSKEYLYANEGSYVIHLSMSILLLLSPLFEAHSIGSDHQGPQNIQLNFDMLFSYVFSNHLSFSKTLMTIFFSLIKFLSNVYLYLRYIKFTNDLPKSAKTWRSLKLQAELIITIS